MQLKRNNIYKHVVNFFEIVKKPKISIQLKKNHNNERLILLQKAHELDKKLTQMFYNYVMSEKTYELKKTSSIVSCNCFTKKINKDNKQSTIDLKELIQDLTIYYADYIHTHNIELSISTELNVVCLPVVKESFYQIIFSILDCKLQFLSEQDSISLSLDQQDDHLIISIKDNGFLLSAMQLKEYSKKLSAKNNLFFLHWNDVMSVLDDYAYHYQVINNNQGNFFKLDFLLQTTNYANHNSKKYA